MTGPSRPREIVLVIEADRDIRRSIVQVLEDEGLAVSAAEDGAAALGALRAPGAELPGLILVDLRMAAMNGWAFRAEQLRDPRLACIPTILLTEDGDAINDAARFNPAAVVKKPVELSTLLAAVEPYVDFWSDGDGSA